MATQIYDFSVPGEYTLDSVTLASGAAVLSGDNLTGTVKGEVLFQGAILDSFTATETPGVGTIRYGLEIDTVLSYHNGVAWVPSNGSEVQLNTLAVVQANIASVLNTGLPVVKPFIRLTRSLITDPSPEVDDLTVVFTPSVPNRQVILATDAAVALDTGVGGVASPGQTRVTLDPAQVTYRVGTNELWVFRNGVMQPGSAYIEEDSSHVVFNALLDAIGPSIDEVEFRVAMAGSSNFIAPPVSLTQARPPTRPDNFGGNYEFS